MGQQWTRKELVKVFEYLLEREIGITSHPAYRKHLDRDLNLFANQVTREANGNIAYRSVDFDLLEMTDDEIWQRFDSSDHGEMIEENAAVAIMKMAEKLKIVA